MWIGSENGLFRYDGFHLTPYYKLFPSPATQEMAYVSALDTDERGRIYASLHTGKILRLDISAAEIRTYQIGAGQEDIVDIHQFVVDDEVIWGATEAGLLRIDMPTGNYELLKPITLGGLPLKADVLYAVYPDPEITGLLWLGSVEGLLSYHIAEQEFQTHFLTFERARNRSEQIFGCIATYEPGQLWCSGYASGIRTLHKANGQWTNQLEEAFRQDIMRMEHLEESTYGVHYDYGAGVLNSETRQMEFYRDPASRTVGYEQRKYHTLYLDRSEQLWLGSDAGFCRFKPRAQSIRHVFLPGRDNESEFFFTAAMEDMGGYYLAVTAFGHNLYKWYKTDGRVEIIPNSIFKETDTQLDIFQSQKRPDGTVDLFTRKGIWRYHPVAERVEPVNLNLKGLKVETWRDQYLVQTDRNTFKQLVDGRVARTLKFDGKGLPKLSRITSYTIVNDQFWAVGEGTLLSMDLPDGEPVVWRNTPTQNYFAYPNLGGLEVIGSTVVVGNRSAGFEVFEYRGRHLQKKAAYYEDLANRRARVFSSASRGTKVYLCTSQGLLIYDSTEDRLMTVDKADGLLVQNLGKTWASEVTPMEDGRVVVSGHGFFSIIEEGALETVEPSLQVAQVLQNDQPLPKAQLGSELELPYNENAFEVRYRVQPLALSHKLRYRHRLKGLDDDWVQSRGGEIRYTSLPPGRYTLELQASADHQWREVATTTMKVHVVPPFYQTYWFYALCAIGAVSVAGYLYHKRVSYIRQEAALKSAFNKKVAQLEMEALRAQMNPHFIFNALNSIEYYINEENTEDAVNYLQKFAALIRMTLQNSKQPYISLQEELASLKYYIEIEQMRLDNSFDFRLEIEEGLSTAHIQIPPLLLQPYVENAIWHGLLYQHDKRGMLKIQCRASYEQTEIRITDNGIGREKSAVLQRQRMKNKKSMGMIITQRRMELNQAITGIQAEVAVEDLIDERGDSDGTSVVIRLTQKPKN